MLYDHTTDPAENINISEQPAQAKTVDQLTTRLRSAKGKDGDLPTVKK
jgi:hypothetical protein